MLGYVGCIATKELSKLGWRDGVSPCVCAWGRQASYGMEVKDPRQRRLWLLVGHGPRCGLPSKSLLVTAAAGASLLQQGCSAVRELFNLFDFARKFLAGVCVCLPCFVLCLSGMREP